MQVFKTDKKIYFANELKSWAWSILFALLFFSVLRMFTPLTEGSVLTGVMILLLLKLRDVIVPYHIQQIHIDTRNNQVSFMLKSIMSGQEIMTYNLEQLKTELTENHGLKRLFTSQLSIKIISSKNEEFKIDSRYGFPVTALRELVQAIKRG